MIHTIHQLEIPNTTSITLIGEKILQAINHTNRNNRAEVCLTLLAHWRQAVYHQCALFLSLSLSLAADLVIVFLYLPSTGTHCTILLLFYLVYLHTTVFSFSLHLAALVEQTRNPEKDETFDPVFSQLSSQLMRLAANKGVARAHPSH